MCESSEREAKSLEVMLPQISEHENHEFTVF